MGTCAYVAPHATDNGSSSLGSSVCGVPRFMPNSSIDTFLNKLGNQAGDMDRAALRDWLAGLSSVARRAGQASPRDDLAALAEKLGSVDEALLDDLAAGLAQLPPQSPTAAPPDAGTQADRIKALRRDMKAARMPFARCAAIHSHIDTTSGGGCKVVHFRAHVGLCMCPCMRTLYHSPLPCMHVTCASHIDT